MLGGPPQHLAHKGEPTRLVIGARNIIREHVTMNTGTVSGRGVTTVGSDGLFMAGCHVAHDCVVGDNVVLANSATLGGHVTMGDYVFMGGLGGRAPVQPRRPLRLHRRPGGRDQGRDPLRLGLGQPRPPGGAEPRRA